MHSPGWTTIAALLLLAIAWPGRAADLAQGEAAWRKLAEPGTVAMIRHGRTSGGAGDPPGFKLDDCGSQRNLTEDGRAQMAKLGEQFRAHGVQVTAVLSSQWCRCLDTAKLAFGRAEPWAPLNNLFGRREHEPAQTAEVRKRIAAWKGPGTLVLVSQGANISPATGVYPGEGEVVVLRPDPATGFRAVGRIATGG
jgi:phosphohistidine phosphatase SixA